MAKFTVDVIEVVHYQIEVEAPNAKKANRIAEHKFFETDINDRRWMWEYSVDQTFDRAEEVVDEEA